MDKQIVLQILSSNSLESVPESFKKKFQIELLNHFKVIENTAKEIGIDIDELWRAYITKSNYNKYDTRESRHIMYSTNEEKAQVIEHKKNELQKEYSLLEVQINVIGFDMITQKFRDIDREKEYPLAFFRNESDINILSESVPPYIKFKVLKCKNLYIVNIPNQCIDKFPYVFILLAQKKKTIMIGIDGYSPIVNIPNVTMYEVGQLRVSFISADVAEEIDEAYNNKFWFYENYNPKRKYHYIYSNSKK